MPGWQITLIALAAALVAAAAAVLLDRARTARKIQPPPDPPPHRGPAARPGRLRGPAPHSADSAPQGRVPARPVAWQRGCIRCASQCSTHGEDLLRPGKHGPPGERGSSGHGHDLHGLPGVYG